MNKYLFLPILGLLFFSKMTYSQETYVVYLKNKALFEKGKALFFEKRHKEAIDAFSDINSISFNVGKYIYSAECFAQLNDYERASSNLYEAVKNGFDSLYIDKEVLSPLKIDFSPIPTLAANYTKSINHSLVAELCAITRNDQIVRSKLNNVDKKANRKEFDSLITQMVSVDSSNVVALKRIILEKGWPGRKVIGDGRDACNPHLIALHSNEEDNLFFLDECIKACRNSIEDWSTAETIFSNLFWRYQERHGYVKLYHLYFKENGAVELEKSMLLFGSLAKVLNTNRKMRIKIFLTGNYISNEDRDILNPLNTIKKELTQMGVDERQVEISETVFSTLEANDTQSMIVYTLTFN